MRLQTLGVFPDVELIRTCSVDTPRPIFPG